MTENSDCNLALYYKNDGSSCYGLYEKCVYQAEKDALEQIKAGNSEGGFFSKVFRNLDGLQSEYKKAIITRYIAQMMKRFGKIAPLPLPLELGYPILEEKPTGKVVFSCAEQIWAPGSGYCETTVYDDGQIIRKYEDVVWSEPSYIELVDTNQPLAKAIKDLIHANWNWIWHTSKDLQDPIGELSTMYVVVDGSTIYYQFRNKRFESQVPEYTECGKKVLALEDEIWDLFRKFGIKDWEICKRRGIRGIE